MIFAHASTASSADPPRANMRMPGTLEDLGALREWTNSWQNGGRVLRTGADPAARVFAGGDLARVGFRIVRGMTGR